MQYKLSQKNLKPKPKAPYLTRKGVKKEERDNFKHKPGNFRMLLKVLMDFRSLKIRDKAHAPTHIHRQKEI